MFKPTKIAHLAALLVLLLASAISAARTDDIFVNITANSNTNHGIFIAGADNFILNNITSSGNTRDGINLWFANNSIIANSSIYGNSGFGVYINNTSANNQFYNNLFNNTVNFGINNTTNSANSWNRTEVAGTSIMYGPSLGGNFWATPSNTGYSQNTSCNDSDGDGICDAAITLATSNVDNIALAYQPPAVMSVTINNSTGGITFTASSSSLLGWARVTGNYTSTLNGTYKWFKNGAVNTTGSFSSAANGTVTNIANLSATFAAGQNWTLEVTALVWNSNSTPLNSTKRNISSTAPSVVQQNTFTNYSAGHKFNVTAAANDPDGASDITRVSISSSVGSCTQFSNSSSGNVFNVTYNCTGTGLRDTAISITFNDSGGNAVSTTSSTNIYPNIIPTTGTPALSPSTAYRTTAVINCTNASSSDSDNDTITFNYSWYKNGAALNIFTRNITNASFVKGDNLVCQITATDGLINVSKTSTPSSIANDATAGDVLWSNTGNALTNNGVYADVTLCYNPLVTSQSPYANFQGETGASLQFGAYGRHVKAGTLQKQAPSNGFNRQLPSLLAYSPKVAQFVGCTQGSTSQYLLATQYNFDVPYWFPVLGIVAGIERYAETSISDNSVKLYNNTGFIGNDKSAAAAWPASETVDSFGSSTDLWGTGLSAQNVNGSTFGVGLRGSTSEPTDQYGYVDYFSVTVYYLNLTAYNSANSTQLTISNSVPTLTQDLTFRNYSSSHQFNVTAAVTDIDGASDISQVTISTTSGICTQRTNSSSGNLFNVTFNCSGNGLATANIVITFNDSSGSTVNSSNLSNQYPNQNPSTGTPTLSPTTAYKNTSEVTCNNGSTTDGDSDTVTFYYLWYRNETTTGITTQAISNTSYGKTDRLACQITPTDSFANGTSKNSSSLIISNSIPVSSTPTLTPTSATRSDANITCLNGSTSDADNDAISYSYLWYKNGTSTGITTDFITNSSYWKNVNLTCQITPSDGPELPAASSAITFANDSSPGGTAWSNPSNAQSSDNSYALVGLSDSNSQYLKVTNFSFSVPNNSIITGIVAQVEKKKSGALALIYDLQVRLVKNGVIGTTDRSNSSVWPTTDIIVTYGNSTDLWGLNWTASDINNASFGLAFAAYEAANGNGNASVDYVNITVYYNSTGSAINSTTLTVSSAPPATGTPTLSPSGAFINTTNVTCLNGSTTDPDGDTSFTYTYLWYKNGASSGVATSHITNSSFTRFDNLTCQITPNDGSVNGSAVNSSKIVVSNYIPITAAPLLSPTSANKSTANITCTSGTTSDLEGDSVSFTYLWYKNSVSTGVNDSYITNSSYNKSDQIICQITPSDNVPITTSPFNVSNSTYSGGTIAWSNLNYARDSDNSYSTVTLANNEISHDLQATGFNFNIPSNAVITGVKAEIEKKASAANSIAESAVQLIVNGTVSGTDHSNSSYWPTTDTYVVYGNSTDTWGLTLSPADFNSASFGINIITSNADTPSRTASIDHIRITVYYTGAAQNSTTLTIGSSAPGIASQNGFANASAGHSFNVSATVADADTWSDIESVSISTTSGTCQLISSNHKLVGYWPLEEGSGTSSANSVTGVNGVFTTSPAPSWQASGKYGKALNVSATTFGAGLRITENQSRYTFPNNFSISAWFNPNTTGSAGGWILGKYDSSNRHVYGLFLNTSNNLSFKLLNSTGSYIGTTGVTGFSSNSWHHAAGVVNGTHALLYLDGVLQTSNAITGDVESNSSVTSGYLGAGVVVTSSGFIFNGSIDDVKIFNRSLSLAEIINSVQYNTSATQGSTTLQSIFNCSGTPLAQANVSITFTDASGLSISTTTSSNNYPNQNPAISTTPRILNSSGGTDFYAGSALLGYANATDADSDLINYSYKWYKNGALNSPETSTVINNAGGLEANVANISGGLSAGQNWILEITATDGYGNSAATNSSQITISNTAPSIAQQNGFANASAGHSFNVTAAASDIDGASDIAKVSVSSSSGSCVQLTNSSTGNVFNVTYNCTGAGLASTGIVITFNDSSGSIASTSNTSNAYPNQNPANGAATILNSTNGTTFYLADRLVGFANSTDADSDSVNYTFKWYKNGALDSQDTSTVLNSASGVRVNIANITSGLAAGQNWTLEITATDGYSNSSPANSTQITIATPPNTAPSIISSSIKNSSGGSTFYTGFTLFGWASAQDNESTTLNYTYKWYLSSTLNQSGNYSNAQNNTEVNIANYTNTVSKGQSWKLEVIATDGSLNSSATNSTAITISNSIPTNPSTPSISSPATAYKNSTLTASSGDSTDADGDTISYYYAWKNDTAVLQNSTSQTFDCNSYSGCYKNVNISVSIMASTSDANSSWSSYSTAKQIQNAAPSAPAFAPFNSTITKSNTVSVSASGAADADSDAITYLYQFSNSTSALQQFSSNNSFVCSAYSGCRTGQNITVTVISNDGTTNSTGNVTNTTQVANSAPTTPNTPSFSSGTYKNDTFVASCSGSTDADGDSISYYYQFENSAGTSTLQSYSTSASYSSCSSTAACNKTGDIKVKCKAYDGTDYSSETAYATQDILNLAPVPVGSRILNSTNGTTYFATDRLVGFANATDTDGDALNYTFKWYKNGALDSQGASTAINGASGAESNIANITSGLSVGQNWVLEVVATDGSANSSALNSSQATIISANTAPTISTISIKNSTAGTSFFVTSSLLGWVSAIDNQSASLNATYKWYLNGTLNSTGSFAGFANNTDTNVANISSSLLRKGQNWTFEATVSDGSDNSTPANSTQITISNSIPTTSAPSITPTTAYKNTTPLTCNNGSTSDSDLDTITFYYLWYKNGTTTGITTQTITNSSYSTSDSLVCQITPSDGQANGTSINSSAVTIRALAPTIVSIRILNSSTPADNGVSYHTNGVLYAFANATSEAGSLNYTYKWYVNGTLYSTGSYTGAASGTELKIANMSGVQTTQSWKIELTANASGDTAAQNSSAAAVDSLVVACGNLSITGASYTLGVSISDIASSCFNLTANSVSLQCNGLSIDGADTAGTAGINVTGFNSSAISGCSISDFDTGIYLSSSNGATITGNNITSHATYGINIQSSATYSIYSNIFNSTTNFNLGGSPTGKWNTTKSAGTNVVGGPYVGGNYWATPAGAGFSQTCLDADTEGICDGAYALGSGNTDSLPLSKITYLSGCASIGTRGSYVLTASVSNSGSTCMQLQANNVVLNCNGSTIDGSSVAGTYGVSLQNYNNSIVKNCIIKEFETSLYVSGSSNNSFTNLSTKSNSNYGVYLSSVSSSTLSQITSASNTQYGIYLDSSSSNSIYNNIFNNTANAFSSGSTNLWNTSKTYGTNIAGGPNIGGNFWANPSATGFSQNCTNADGDGICDSTYTVSAGEIDYLPLTLGNKSTTEFTLNVNISSTNYISVYTSNGTSDSSFSFAPVSFENFTSNISLLSNISANTSGGELGFLVTNDGNTNVSINITSDKSAAQFIGGSSPLFQAFGAVNETGACPSLVASMQDLSTTSVNICPLLISSDSQDTIWAHIKVQISPDSPQGSSSAVITFTSTAV